MPQIGIHIPENLNERIKEYMHKKSRTNKAKAMLEIIDNSLEKKDEQEGESQEKNMPADSQNETPTQDEGYEKKPDIDF